METSSELFRLNVLQYFYGSSSFTVFLLFPLSCKIIQNSMDYAFLSENLLIYKNQSINLHFVSLVSIVGLAIAFITYKWWMNSPFCGGIKALSSFINHKQRNKFYDATKSNKLNIYTFIYSTIVVKVTDLSFFNGKLVTLARNNNILILQYCLNSFRYFFCIVDQNIDIVARKREKKKGAFSMNK